MPDLCNLELSQICLCLKTPDSNSRWTAVSRKVLPQKGLASGIRALRGRLHVFEAKVGWWWRQKGKEKEGWRLTAGGGGSTRAASPEAL